MEEREVGKVSTFFAKPGVAGIDLTEPVKVGDKLRISGHTTHVEFAVDSMQIHNVNVQEGKECECTRRKSRGFRWHQGAGSR